MSDQTHLKASGDLNQSVNNFLGDPATSYTSFLEILNITWDTLISKLFVIVTKFLTSILRILLLSI